MRLLRKILIIPTMAILFASPPDWVDTPGDYQFTATIVGGIVLNINGEQMGDDGDMFAAFDDTGNVRGSAIMLSPPFGPYQGTPVFEVQLRSNDSGDILYFQYYDASEDAILEICQTYEFVNNDILGNVNAPVEFNIGSFCLSFSSATISSVNITYESNTEIAGFQFNVEGVTLTSASGGDAGENGFSISFTSTVLGFAMSGATIPAGSGTLLSLEFEVYNEDPILDVSNVIISGSGGSSIPSSGPGSIEITTTSEYTPDLFEFEQSTLQAFYYFNSVTINGNNVDTDDWVGAFNGDVCVGSTQWDTSQCGGGICEVPVMGYDGSEGTEGYMNMGAIPSFKIYDASSGVYYDATPSEIEPWENFAFFNIESLEVVLPIPGCMDPASCNYDPSATNDDESCWSEYAQTCYKDTDGNGHWNESQSGEYCYCSDLGTEWSSDEESGPEVPGCTEDEACNYNASATINNDSCYYEGIHDCEGNCIADIDCAGDCGGLAVEDECDVCGGDNSTCTDCNGVVNGTAVAEPNFGEDSCITNECVGGNTDLIACTQDCAGEWGGTLVDDICGICGGDNSTCEGVDCAGDEGGNAIKDECDVCGGDNSTCTDCNGVVNGTAVADPNFGEDSCITNECVGGNTDLTACTQDCAGEWGGSAVDDDCGICGGTQLDGDTDTDGDECETDCEEELDCAGECGGLAVIDDCGVCGDNNSTCTDCNGVVNGTAVADPNFGEDSCITNECVGGDTGFTVCTKDCAGIWGGSALEDNCGICDSISTNDCNHDCAGDVGGSAIIDECDVCRVSSDDVNWNSTCTDCIGVVNGTAVADPNFGEDSCITNECVSGNTDLTACTQDCAGEWGGNAEDDDCGICGGEGSAKNYDCEGNCLAEVDCQGICGGLNIPTFQCQNACVVCNPAGCINLDSDCNSMDISSYLLPDEFGISKIFPNPFNPVTHIQYELTQFGLISIKIYDIQGRVVDQLINEYQSPAHYSLNWNAVNHASGMYIVEMVMQLENNEVSRDLQKILYLK